MFDFRQLHFHLPQGSTSFLRVHKPEKFGDNMDNVRHTIVAANKNIKPITGFETGRLYSGIRGVMPILAENPKTGELQHAGAVEAGTSFRQLLVTLSETTKSDFAVLLTQDHLRSIVWPDFLDRLLSEKPINEKFMVEESSSPLITTLLDSKIINKTNKRNSFSIHDTGDSQYCIFTFPLRDFLGSVEPQRADVGLIVAWSDVSEVISDFKHNFHVNIWFAVIGFLLVEIILFAGIRLATGQLFHIVEIGRKDLRDANEKLNRDIEERKKIEKEKEILIVELQSALDEVKTLGDLLPICSWCKKIRDDQGYWQQLEKYISERSEAQFSHSICDDCLNEHFPDLDLAKK